VERAEKKQQKKKQKKGQLFPVQPFILAATG